MLRGVAGGGGGSDDGRAVGRDSEGTEMGSVVEEEGGEEEEDKEEEEAAAAEADACLASSAVMLTRTLPPSVTVSARLIAPETSRILPATGTLVTNATVMIGCVLLRSVGSVGCVLLRSGRCVVVCGSWTDITVLRLQFQHIVNVAAPSKISRFKIGPNGCRRICIHKERSSEW